MENKELSVDEHSQDKDGNLILKMSDGSLINAGKIKVENIKEEGFGAVTGIMVLDDPYNVEKAFDDDDYNIRYNAYEELGYTEKAFDDDEYIIRYKAYTKLGFTEKAFDDDDSNIRYNAYEQLGYTEKAFDDDDYNIRYNAYEALGYTEEALNDSDVIVVSGAVSFFTQCAEILNTFFKCGFTQEEATLLELNGMKVNRKTIIEEK